MFLTVHDARSPGPFPLPFPSQGFSGDSGFGLHFMPGVFCLEAVSVQAVFMCHAEEREEHRASNWGDGPPPQSWDLRAEPAFPACLWDAVEPLHSVMKGQGGP